MDKKCEKCGSANITKGKLVGYSGVVFISENTKGIVKKSSAVTAYACKDCGCVFELGLEHPERI